MHVYGQRTSNFEIFNKRKRVYAKENARRYPAKTLSVADYTDDLAFLLNAFAQANSLLYSLEQGALASS